MNYRKGMRLAGAMVGSAALLLLVFLSAALPAKAGLALAAAAGWVAVLRAERALRREEYQVDLIRVLNHQRHDWMNDLQVVYGYLRMNKTDKLFACVDRIKEKARMESDMAKLGVPSLVAFLLTYRSRRPVLDLVVKVEGDIRLDKLPMEPERVSALIRDAVLLFEETGAVGEEAPQTLYFGVRSDGGLLLLEYRFEGKYGEHDLRERLDRLRKHYSNAGVDIEQEFAEHRAAVIIKLPADRK